MPKTDNLKFIESLDKKLHCYVGSEYCGKKDRMDEFKTKRNKEGNDEYIKMSKKEYDALVKIIKEEKLIITPCSPRFGFIPGFAVFTYPKNNFVVDKETCERVLTFLEDQLPKGVVYENLELFCKSKENTKLLAFYDFDEIRDKSYYEY